ncbi:uncharacterized protein CTHT_0064860 [Thermochaetoides thermophila DSM 1495]|uniref:Rhodopsin domain-containing protein n=1 Tax=Chaetomium thermophilum (strain DSM 1495 / CBS 144.50 / IMI 039719) TaxID=759272 RepID=G0SG32_CHATD|nr:hypothetical protein CTHT_0064860 [Thermochaetoides thermophila DSM 1495]EGS17171.1 hypothetical protein CTHT_0064860 [Thermochaetoides thermophila DSM 1495]
MRLPPPEVMATWPKPNYVNPETRGSTLIVVEILTLFLAVTCVALRLYVRIVMMRKTDWDDWLMVGASIFGAGITACVILAVTRYGWNIHVWDLTPMKMVSGRQVSLAAQAIFVGATCLAKTSILLSYLRLAPAKSLFRRLTIATIWFVILNNIAFFVVLFTQCIPLSSYWNLGPNHADDCLSEGSALIAHASFTVASDLLVWVLPLPALYQAKLPFSQRIALIVLFSFGLVVVVAACLRTYWIHHVVNETYDVTWEGFQLWMWTAIEVHLGIICGCVPWLKSLFRFWRAKKTGTSVSAMSGAMSGASAGGTGRRTRSKSDIRPVGSATVCVEGAVFKMDTLGKPPVNKEAYLDLESCAASHTTRDESNPG